MVEGERGDARLLEMLLARHTRRWLPPSLINTRYKFTYNTRCAYGDPSACKFPDVTTNQYNQTNYVAGPIPTERGKPYSRIHRLYSSTRGRSGSTYTD